MTTDAGYRQPTQHWSVVLPVLAVSVLALCGLVLLGLGTVRVGVLPILIGAVGALIRVVIVVATFLWVDRWEPRADAPTVVRVWLGCVRGGLGRYRDQRHR